MPRAKYEIKNRYCLRSKLAETTFLIVLAGFLDGATASFLYRKLRNIQQEQKREYRLLDKVFGDFVSSNKHFQSPSLKVITKYYNAFGWYLWHSNFGFARWSTEDYRDKIYAHKNSEGIDYADYMKDLVPASLKLYPLEVYVFNELVELSKSRCGLKLDKNFEVYVALAKVLANDKTGSTSYGKPFVGDLEPQLKEMGFRANSREIIFFLLLLELVKHPLDFSHSEFGMDCEDYVWY